MCCERDVVTSRVCGTPTGRVKRGQLSAAARDAMLAKLTVQSSFDGFDEVDLVRSPGGGTATIVVVLCLFSWCMHRSLRPSLKTSALNSARSLTSSACVAKTPVRQRLIDARVWAMRIDPPAVLASNTSTIMLNVIGQGLRRDTRARIVGAAPLL